MEREAVIWNCSCVDALKGAVLHRTVPRDRVNGKPIRTYEERFHMELLYVKLRMSGDVLVYGGKPHKDF